MIARMLLPSCIKSNDSLIDSKGMRCVMNSSISNSLFKYRSTNFGTLSTLFQPPNAVPFHVRPVTSWNGRVLISVPEAATPTMTDTPQPLAADSRAARIVLTLPTHSKVKSNPLYCSTSTCWIGRSPKSLGLMHSVAPNVLAEERE